MLIVPYILRLYAMVALCIAVYAMLGMAFLNFDFAPFADFAEAMTTLTVLFMGVNFPMVTLVRYPLFITLFTT